MRSKATTVEQYLSELPEDRRQAISSVREVILKNLDKDYEEGRQGAAANPSYESWEGFKDLS